MIVINGVAGSVDGSGSSGSGSRGVNRGGNIGLGNFGYGLAAINGASGLSGHGSNSGSCGKQQETQKTSC
jgi:hypothetical protein